MHLNNDKKTKDCFAVDQKAQNSYFNAINKKEAFLPLRIIPFKFFGIKAHKAIQLKISSFIKLNKIQIKIDISL